MNNTSTGFSNWQYQNVALSVVTQCALLVHDLANHGTADSENMSACIGPVLCISADSVAEIYPDLRQFHTGYQILQEIMDSNIVGKHQEVIRYLPGLLHLRAKLLRDGKMQRTIRDRIKLLAARQETTLPSDREMEQFSSLAALYQDTISHLPFRIHVSGRLEHLKDNLVANKIRTLLLAGIRSAVLWHQLGGRRWHLFFYRKRIRSCVGEIRQSLLALH